MTKQRLKRWRPAWLSVLISVVFLVQIVAFWFIYWRGDIVTGFGRGGLLLDGIYYPYPIHKWQFALFTLVAVACVAAIFGLTELLLWRFGCPRFRFSLVTLLVIATIFGLAALPISIWWNGGYPDTDYVVPLRGIFESRPWLMFGYINLVLLLTGLIIFLMETILRRRSLF